MDLGLTDRRALVLGSTSGLGRAVATALAAEGAHVAVTGRRGDLAAEVADSLPKAVALTGDITEEGTPERLVAEARAGLGGLDILVVNTGGGRPGPLLDVSTPDEDAAYRTLLRPALAATRAAVPALLESPAGRLVFITARSVLEATPDLSLSGVFRSGVTAAARSLALELAPRVLVNVVVPGQFETPALARFQDSLAARTGTTTDEVREAHRADIPLQRYGRADELGDVVAFLCSGRASYVTGSVVRVDGGSVRGY